MSERAAAYALAKVAETGDLAALGKVAQLILRDHAVAERFDPEDIAIDVELAAQDIARGSVTAEEALLHLTTSLRGRAGTTAIGIFAAASASQIRRIGCASVGPVAALLAEDVLRRVDGDWARLPIRIAWQSVSTTPPLARAVDGEPFAGCAQPWERSTLLAGLQIAATTHGSDLSLRMSCSLRFLSDTRPNWPAVQTMRLPASVPLDVDRILANDEALAVIADCLDSDADALVPKRLGDATPWIQIAFDSLAYPDAVLALGVALEVLLGSTGNEDVTKVISMRTAYLLREGSSRDELS